MEVYQILGQTLFTLVIHGSSLTVVNYKEKEAFVGEIGGAHIGNAEIDQAIGTPIQYPELARLLLFRLMDLPHDQHHVEYVKDQLHMVNIKDSRMTSEAWLTMDPIKMTVLTYHEGEGVSKIPPMNIIYQKFSYIDGIYFPTHIEMKDSKRSYQLSYERLFVNKSLEESLFILEAPPHFTMK